MINCKDCEYWTRRILYKRRYRKDWEEWDDSSVDYSSVDDIHHSSVLECKASKFGICECDKIIYTGAGGVVQEDDIDHENQPDVFLFSDGEGYGAYFYTGESFGCVHGALK